jgi:hypothetical protein
MAIPDNLTLGMERWLRRPWRPKVVVRRARQRLFQWVWGLRPLARHRMLESNMVALHDALAQTPLAGRYWVWGGALLGWAREGRLLAHDNDADFALFREDLPAFRAGWAALAAAGFDLGIIFVNNDGQATEFVFYKDHLRFEFFIFDRDGSGIRYWLFYPPGKLEMLGRLPWDGVEPLNFLGRTWLKPRDHEAHLAAMYGDWRTPEPGYDYVTDEKSIVARYRWQREPVWDTEAWLRESS